MEGRIESADLAWLRRLARGLLGDTHAAEDLVQDTLVAALERGPVPVEGATRIQSPRAWLAGVARRLAARRFRSEGRRRAREHEVARPDVLPDSSALLQRAEVAESLSTAVRRLPEPYRRTLLLQFLDEVDVASIARAEGIPADTVRWRSRRGLALLREELERSSGRAWSGWVALLVPLAGDSAPGPGPLVHEAAPTVSSGLSSSLPLLLTMKALVASAAVLATVSLWFTLQTDAPADADPSRPSAARDLESPRVTSAPAELLEPTAVGGSRATVAADGTDDVQPLAPAVRGRLEDPDGRPVAGALVYLADGNDPERALLVEGRPDRAGRFALAPAAAPERELELGVAANGFLRHVERVDAPERGGDELRIVLRHGERLTGRVVDPEGRAVPGLEVLVYSWGARLDHVSPSQSGLRARRALLSGSGSSYEQCVATSDEEGRLRFSGLPAGRLEARTLDAGTSLVASEPERFDGATGFVEWTAVPRLGVELEVRGMDGELELQAAATFRVDVVFEDGEEAEYEQWVGRGRGRVSFQLDEEVLPQLADRRVIAARFHGTASGPGGRVDWSAPARSDPEGLTGLQRHRVRLEPREDEPAVESAAPAAAAQPDVPEPVAAWVTLEVRDPRGAPMEAPLVVRWDVTTPDGVRRDGGGRVDAQSPGLYPVELFAGSASLTVREWGASGSLDPWRGEVFLEPGQNRPLSVEVDTGGTVELLRPIGWEGEWFVRASRRSSPDEEWRGSNTYGTEEGSLLLRALEPAEWRFELRLGRDSSEDTEVRLVEVRAGERLVR